MYNGGGGSWTVEFDVYNYSTGADPGCENNGKLAEQQPVGR